MLLVNRCKKVLVSGVLAAGMAYGALASAADYTFDIPGMHAGVQFRVQHLGYSWLYGRFDKFDGSFSYDKAEPEKAKVSVTIDTASVSSNHAERDKHLRAADFLDVEKFPEAKFESTEYTATDETTGVLKGNLTLRGVTKPVEISVTKIGEGKDPWGGYRAGFEGTTTFKMADFGMTKNLGPASTHVEMILSVEGVQKK